MAPVAAVIWMNSEMLSILIPEALPTMAARRNGLRAVHRVSEAESLRRAAGTTVQVAGIPMLLEVGLGRAVRAQGTTDVSAQPATTAIIRTAAWMAGARMA